MFGQKRLSREGGVEIVVKELCTRMVKLRHLQRLRKKLVLKQLKNCLRCILLILLVVNHLFVRI